MKMGLRSFCGGCVAALALLSATALVHAGKLTENWKDNMKAMDEAKLTATAAVTAAETHSKGKAIAVMPSTKDKALSITVMVNNGGKCQTVTVDKSGKASDAKDASATDTSCGTAVDAVKQMETAKMTLSSAITAAEAHHKDKAGKAIAAMTDVKDGKLMVMVAVVVGDKVHTVTVDGTGKAVKSEEDKPIKGG